MKLFDDFEYENIGDLKEFLSEIDTENALTIINLALSYASKQGCFNINESHCIFMCLLKLTNEKKE